MTLFLVDWFVWSEWSLLLLLAMRGWTIFDCLLGAVDDGDHIASSHHIETASATVRVSSVAPSSGFPCGTRRLLRSPTCACQNCSFVNQSTLPSCRPRKRPMSTDQVRRSDWCVQNGYFKNVDQSFLNGLFGLGNVEESKDIVLIHGRPIPCPHHFSTRCRCCANNDYDVVFPMDCHKLPDDQAVACAAVCFLPTDAAFEIFSYACTSSATENC